MYLVKGNNYVIYNFESINLEKQTHAYGLAKSTGCAVYLYYVTYFFLHLLKIKFNSYDTTYIISQLFQITTRSYKCVNKTDILLLRYKIIYNVHVYFSYLYIKV